MGMGKMTKVYSAPKEVKQLKRKVNKLVYDSVPHSLSKKIAFPASKTVTMKYSQQFTMNAASGVIQNYQFKLNGIFDPDVTITGHQPYAHDQWGQFYSRYRVDKFSYKLHLSGTSAADSPVVVNITNSATPPTTIQHAGELDLSKTCLAILYETKILKGSVDLCKLTGVSKEVYKADDRYSALFGADPAEVLRLHIQTARDDGTSSTMIGIIECQYTVLMWDPITLAQS